jgi:hypothetical protein
MNTKEKVTGKENSLRSVVTGRYVVPGDIDIKTYRTREYDVEEKYEEVRCWW